MTPRTVIHAASQEISVRDFIESKEKFDGTKLRGEKIKDWDDVVEQLERIYTE